MADIFDEVAKPQAQPKQAAPAAPAASAGSTGDIFDQAAKQVYSPADQDQALQRLETSPGDKWYQQRVDISPDAGPISRFAGNIIGNPSLEDLGTGLSSELRHPINSARMLLASSGEQQRDLFGRAKREWNAPGIGAKSDAAVHALESAIPFIGPGMARIGDQFATGDIAGGAGGVTGMTATALAAPEARETATAPVRATGRLIAQPTASRLAGGAAGAAIGEGLDHPYLGFLAGERVLGPSIRYYGSKISRLGLDRGPRPLFDLSTGQPPSMVMNALSRSNPASPGPISVEEPRPTPYRRGPGEVPRDVIRPKLLTQSSRGVEPNIIDAEFEDMPAHPVRGLLNPEPEPIRLSLGIPETPAPVRIGPGGVPPDLIGKPNARVLAGNQGIMTTPIGLLREPRLVQESAFMNPEMELPSPRIEWKPGTREGLEDAGIQDAMNADLEQHGAAARLEQGREFAERNSMDIPKWQRTAEAKARAILDEARQKAEERALTRELGRGLPKPVKAKPTIAPPEAKPSGPPGASVGPQTGKLPGVKVPSPEEPEDLTPILEESLRQARLKRQK